LATAVAEGQTKRQYLMKRDVDVSVTTLRDAKVTCQAGLIATQINTLSKETPTTNTLSAGAIIGVAVAGIALVISIGVVGVFVARKRKQKKRAPKSDSESGVFMTS
jgi:hypothetical protein